MLSSGEQHILILAYELLFKAPENSLVLIDEPEISFHLRWRMNFFENICSIIDSRHLQCIVSTHSPQIFSSKWNYTEDLYEQQNKFIKG